MQSLQAGLTLFRWLLMAVLAALPPGQACSLTVDEAISLARHNLPSFLAAQNRVESSESLYKASLGPYLPSLDASTIQEHYMFDSSRKDYDFSNYEVALSYTLYDGGKRKANRSIARLNWLSTQDQLAEALLELRFAVKSAFFTTMARCEILEERRIQLHDAGKDHEVASGRHKLGAAKLSDVLQASVRLEQARYNVVQAEGELAKSLSQLNSLLGRPLDAPYDLKGSLITGSIDTDLQRLNTATLERPAIKQARNRVQVAVNNKALETSAFFPVLSASAAYNKTDSTVLLNAIDDGSLIGLNVTWNIFELGKFYRKQSAHFQINVSENELSEKVRQLLLELRKAYEDYLTDSRNVNVAREQLRQATHNYSQAFGEYKVGKGDILSLVQAESLLSTAREQLTISKLRLVLSKALLERATGLESLGAAEDQDQLQAQEPSEKTQRLE